MPDGPADDARERATAVALAEIERHVALLVRLADPPLPDDAAPPLERSAYLILGWLRENGAANISRLADELRLDGSTMTRQVIAMERAGLVRRGRDPRDGRVTVVASTAQGRAQLARMRELRREGFARVLAAWSAAELSALSEQLGGLTDALGAARAPQSAGGPAD